MRRIGFACCCCAALVSGCRKSERQASTADTSAGMAAPAAAPAAAPLTVHTLAGRWNMRVMNQAGDSTLVAYVLTATEDPAGWTATFPNRAPVVVHVVVAGDSVVTDAGPFPSLLRKGVQVTTHGVSRLQDGKLVGTNIAHYKVTGADSVRTLRIEGTRAQ